MLHFNNLRRISGCKRLVLILMVGLLISCMAADAGDFGMTDPCDNPTSATLVGVLAGDPQYIQEGRVVEVSGQAYEYLVSGMVIPLLQLNPYSRVLPQDHNNEPPKQPRPVLTGSCGIWNNIYYPEGWDRCESNCAYNVDELTITNQSTGATVTLTSPDQIGLQHIWSINPDPNPPPLVVPPGGFFWDTTLVPDGIYTLRDHTYQDPLIEDFICAKCFWSGFESNTLTVRVLNNAASCNAPTGALITSLVPVGSGTVTPIATQPGTSRVTGSVTAQYSVSFASNKNRCAYGTELIVTHVASGFRKRYPLPTQSWDSTVFPNGLCNVQVGVFPTGNAFFAKVMSPAAKAVVDNPYPPPTFKSINAPMDQDGDIFVADPTDPDAIQSNRSRRKHSIQPLVGGEQETSEQNKADPVNLITGAVYAPEEDDSFASVGHSILLARYYNSRDAAMRSFGKGWSFLYERTVQLAQDGKLTERDGRGVRFVFAPNGSGGFLAAAGYEGRATVDAGGFTIRHARGMTYRYDTSGRLESITDANGNAVTVGYAAGLLATLTAPDGRQIVLSNNGTCITSATLPNGDVHAYSYDALGQLTSHTDPKGNVTSYTYLSGYLRTIRRPGGATTTYTFTGSRVTQVQDPGGTNTSFAYDLANRATTITDRAGGQYRYEYDLNGTITSITDALGNVETRSNDDSFRIRLAKDARGAISTFDYDSVGNITRVSDPLGKVTTFAIDPILARPLRITRPRGEVTRFEYDNAGNVTAVVSPVGGRFEVTYDGRGLPATFKDARGAITQNFFDAHGNQTSSLESLGSSVQIDYDAVSRPTAVTDALGRITRIEYHARHLPSRVVDPLGLTTTFTYDSDLNPTAITRPNNATTNLTFGTFGFTTRITSIVDALGNTTSLEYDPSGRLKKILAPLSRTTSLAYDTLGRLTQITDPAGGTRILAYDAAGNVSQSTNPRGFADTFTYDLAGRLTKITKSGAATATLAYDPSGNVTGYTDPISGTYAITYDLAGRVTAKRDPLNNTTSWSYDSNGNVVQAMDANGNSTSYSYDAQNRLTRITDALGNATRYSLDAAGNTTETIDPRGNWTRFVYDALDRTAEARDSQDRVTRFDYDEVGNLVRLTDARSQQTGFTYDLLGRRIGTTDPLLNSRTVSYDAGGRLVQIVDEESRVATFSYDLADRLLTRSSTADPTSNATLTYDANGNVLTANSASNNYIFTYDPLDRVLTRKGSLAGLVTLNESFTWDAASNRTARFDSKGNRTRYVYDVASRLTQMAAAKNGTSQELSITFGYDPAGRLIRKTYPNSTTVLLGYDIANRLTAYENIHASSILSKHQYTYDPAGNVLSVLDETGATESYTYDALNRLTRASVPTENLASNPPTATGESTLYEFDYDALGNRTRQAVGGSELFPTHNSANQLTQAGLEAYTYDHCGNLLSKTSGSTELRYTYSIANQLRSATSLASGQVQSQETYSYDAFGARTLITKSTGKRVDAFDGAQVMESFNVSNSGTVSAPVRYARDGIGAIVIQLGGTTSPLYQYQDLLGSTTATGNAQGAAVSRYQYSPFGSLIQGNAASTPFLFTGMQQDGFTGYSYSYFRHYDPAAGRWTSRDPIGFAGGDANLYAYVGNNSPRMVDPLGLTARDFTNALDVLSNNAPAQQAALVQPGDPLYGFPGVSSISAASGAQFLAGYTRFTNVASRFTSWFGAAIFAYTAATGKDPYSQQQVSATERAVSGAIAALPVVGGIVSIGNAARVDAAATGSAVILDTNAVFGSKRALGLLKPGEVPVVTSVVSAELRAVVSRGKLNRPRIADELPIIQDVMSVDARINIRGRVQQLSGKRYLPGLFGDGVIGATAQSRGLPVISSDKALVRALQERGVDARLLPGN